MTVYRKHRCAKSHREYKTAAKCIWPWSGYQISGNGPYAVREKLYCRCCGTGWHITLYEDKEQAEKELRKLAEIHEAGKCCGSCTRHEDMIILADTVLQKDNQIDWK